MTPAPSSHPAAGPAAHPRRNWSAGWNPQAAILLLLSFGFALFAGWRQPEFWTAENWQLLLAPLAETGLLALGTTAIIASGGIDLSIGAIVSLAGVLAAAAAPHGAAALLAAALAAGLACGALNGLLIGPLGWPPILVTLGAMIFFQGLALSLFGGGGLAGIPAAWAGLGLSEWAGLPPAFWIFALAAAAVALALYASAWGREIAAIGSNPAAARAGGLPLAARRFSLYLLQGGFCGLAAALMISRLDSARADMGVNLMLPAIAAVVLGGSPIAGGASSVAGTVAGLAAFYILRNGLMLAGVSPYLQDAAAGALLILAVAAGQWRRRRR